MNKPPYNPQSQNTQPATVPAQGPNAQHAGKKKVNPMIGACGISAFPMSARVVYKMAIKEDPQNYLLMQCVGVNVSGQVASVIAGGLLLNLLV